MKAAHLIGQTAPEIAAALGDAGLTSVSHPGLQSAVNAAFAEAEPGDVVLLAPACASFDQFRSYEHRGDVFRECARECGAR